ncbi:MAG: PAS domain S-box protein [Gammaproteobacteria bacterium]|nr:PAS domain S-box protein [Gammaproteobacteria bacterium]
MDDNAADNERSDAFRLNQAHLLDLIFKHSLDCLVLLDRDYNFIRVNESYARACQRPAAEFPGKNHFELYPSGLEQELDVYRRNKLIYKCTARPFVFPDHPEWGETFWDISCVPMLGKNNEIEAFLFTLSDVTARKRAETALRENTRRLNEAQRIAKLGSWELDLRTNHLKWSDEIYRIFEIDPASFGASYEAFLDAIHPDDRTAVNSAYTDSLAFKKPYEIAHRLLMPDGRIKWVNERCESSYDLHGIPLRSVGTVQDITQQMATELRLRETTHLLDSIVENIPNMIFLKDAKELRFVLFNKAGEDLVGYSREAMIGKNDYDFFPQQQADFFTTYDRNVLKNTKVADIPEEFIDTRLNGQRILHTKKIALRDQHDTPRYLLGISEDITEHRNAELQLQQLNATLEQRVAERTHELSVERNFIATVLDTVCALVVVLDRNGCIVRFNHACETLSGYRFEELQGQPVWNYLIPPEQLPGVKFTFENLTTQAIPSIYENEWLVRDGSRCLIAWSNTTLADERGQVTHVIATGIDITARRKAENAVIAAKIEAERANAAKSEFLSHMSHELRTPLNAILGFAQLLESYAQPPLPPIELDSVREILHAGNHLLHLINQVLDLSRIETGRLSLNLSAIELHNVIRETVSLMLPQTVARAITLDVPAGNDPLLVNCDALRLKQVLLNLLSNAVKFNSVGGSIAITTTHDGNGKVRIAITDHGCGIDAEKITKLFIPFERLNADDDAIEGTGIGLALSKRLVELMHGKIGVDSTRGVGSTFWFTLPLAEA